MKVKVFRPSVAERVSRRKRGWDRGEKWQREREREIYDKWGGGWHSRGRDERGRVVGSIRVGGWSVGRGEGVNYIGGVGEGICRR